VQITGDQTDGRTQLDNFIDPERRYPVIATTSRLMSTGVDAQTCKLIVLDQNIQSMTLFKQIIGRGTRLREDLGKTWFTILDFKRATDIFADKDFDGEAVQVYEPRAGEPIVPPEPPELASTGDDSAAEPGFVPPPGDPPNGGDPPQHRRYIVDGRVNVAVARERVQYLNAQGQLITESLRDYTRIHLSRRFESLDQFLQAWSDAERKAALIAELEAQGLLFDALADEVGADLDPFDLLLHVAYGQPTLTRRQRADRARTRVKAQNAFARYGEVARNVIDALLDKYADQGVQTLESIEVLRVPPLDQLGTPTEILRSFGGRQQYDAALRRIELELYSSAS
jgi:type I restriction enzyme R subunit